MNGRDIIVFGASAGGIEALQRAIALLPGDLPAAVFAVIHVGIHSENRLAEVLSRATRLHVKTAVNDEAIQHGVILVAPADHHLIVKPGRVRLTRGPRENLWRPSVDMLFRSAAVAYGPRVIGVILSGALDDGSAGLLAVKRCGGVAIVQEPDDAAFQEMPESALRSVEVDYVLRTEQMAAVIADLVATPAGSSIDIPEDLKLEAQIAEAGRGTPSMDEQPGELSGFTCADCGGPLWKQPEDPLRFRCLVGHAYTARSLLEGMNQSIETSLWAAIRQFEQRGNLQRAMAQADVSKGRRKLAEHHRRHAEEVEAHAAVLRQLLFKSSSGDHEVEEPSHDPIATPDLTR